MASLMCDTLLARRPASDPFQRACTAPRGSQPLTKCHAIRRALVRRRFQRPTPSVRRGAVRKGGCGREGWGGDVPGEGVLIRQNEPSLLSFGRWEDSWRENR